MSTLTAIEQGFAQVWAEVDDTGALSPEAAARLDVLNLDEKVKVDGFAFAIKGQDADAKKYKELADELLAKAKTAQKRAEWLRDRIHDHLNFMEATEIQGEVWRFKLQKAGKAPVEVLVPAEELPDMLCKISRSPDKELIRGFLENGQLGGIGDWARFGEPSLSLRIY